MVKTRGKAEVKAFIRALPEQIERRLLVPAARAGINVLKDEAADRVTSDEVRENLQTSVQRRDDKVIAKLSVKPGWARSLANWLEYGTSGHFITVQDGAREGRSVARINRLNREGSLKIGNTFVGQSVYHPGARPHPFMRVSLDTRGAQAIATAQTYINANAHRLGTTGSDEE